MTQLDIIRMIGDRLTEIDVRIGSLMPNDPNQIKLQDLRRVLDSRQLLLSRQVFDSNTKKFQTAAGELAAVNAKIQGTIDEIENMQRVLRNVTRFLNAVTSFMTAIGAFA
jgi:hypothetical protein